MDSDMRCNLFSCLIYCLAVAGITITVFLVIYVIIYLYFAWDASSYYSTDLAKWRDVELQKIDTTLPASLPEPGGDMLKPPTFTRDSAGHATCGKDVLVMVNARNNNNPAACIPLEVYQDPTYGISRAVLYTVPGITTAYFILMNVPNFVQPSKPLPSSLDCASWNEQTRTLSMPLFNSGTSEWSCYKLVVPPGFQLVITGQNVLVGQTGKNAAGTLVILNWSNGYMYDVPLWGSHGSASLQLPPPASQGSCGNDALTFVNARNNNTPLGVCMPLQTYMDGSFGITKPFLFVAAGGLIAYYSLLGIGQFVQPGQPITDEMMKCGSWDGKTLTMPLWDNGKNAWRCYSLTLPSTVKLVLTSQHVGVEGGGQALGTLVILAPQSGYMFDVPLSLSSATTILPMPSVTNDTAGQPTCGTGALTFVNARNNNNSVNACMPLQTYVDGIFGITRPFLFVAAGGLIAYYSLLGVGKFVQPGQPIPDSLAACGSWDGKTLTMPLWDNGKNAWRCYSLTLPSTVKLVLTSQYVGVQGGGQAPGTLVILAPQTGYMFDVPLSLSSPVVATPSVTTDASGQSTCGTGALTFVNARNNNTPGSTCMPLQTYVDSTFGITRPFLFVASGGLIAYYSLLGVGKFIQPGQPIPDSLTTCGSWDGATLTMPLWDNGQNAWRCYSKGIASGVKPVLTSQSVGVQGGGQAPGTLMFNTGGALTDPPLN